MPGCCDHCEKEVPGTDGERCPLCRDMVYCDSECRARDWVLHEQECNTLTAPSLTAAALVPYYYDERIAADPEFSVEQEPVDSPLFSAYQLRHVSPDMTVYTRVEAPALSFRDSQDKRSDRIPAGGDPAGAGLPATYTISVTSDAMDDAASVTGDSEADLIYARNTQNPAARQLAGGGLRGLLGAGARRRATREKDALVFWPSPAAVYDANIMLALPKGRIAVTLAAGDRSVTIDGYYRLMGLGERSRLSSQLKRAFQRQLRTKLFRRDGGLQSRQVGLENIRVLRARDLEGNQVALAVLLSRGDRGAARVVDIEFKVYRDDIAPGASNTAEAISASATAIDAAEHWTATPFFCDPRSVDDVNGLHMALAERIARNRALLNALCSGNSDPRDPVIVETQHDIAELEANAAVIREYLTGLERDTPSEDATDAEVPLAVATAIARTTETLFEPVDGMLRVRKFRAKLGRARDLGPIETEVDALLSNLEQARAARDEARATFNEARASASGLRGAAAKTKARIALRLASRRVGALRNEAKDWQKAISKRLNDAAVQQSEQRSVLEALRNKLAQAGLSG